MKDGITFDLTSLGELYFLKKGKIESENLIYTSITEEEEEYRRRRRICSSLTKWYN
ncbi:MAG: hypothetical protein ACXWFC_05480 [Nitrososphaeraceae archaeon]